MFKLKIYGVKQYENTSGLMENKSKLRFSHGDISVIGLSGGARPFRIAASATRYYAGEPMMKTVTYSSGAASVNTITVITDGKPTVATDEFIGIAAKDAPTLPTTLAAHTTSVVVPIPNVTKLRGRAKTAANVDTDAELLLILGDFTQFDLTSAVYTIDDTAAADAAGLQIVDGNPAKSTLDVTVDARAMRLKIA